MQSWKESANERRKFRQSNSDPEIPKHKKRRGDSKPYKVRCKGFWIFDPNKTEDFNLNSYKTLEDAEKGFETHKKGFWGKWEMEIVGP